jgi:hypothetical protein
MLTTSSQTLHTLYTPHPAQGSQIWQIFLTSLPTQTKKFGASDF